MTESGGNIIQDASTYGNREVNPVTHQQQKFEFSLEEIRILRECNKESFYQRCAGLFGYIIGKFSYKKTCEDKFLNLPNSRFGEMVRRKRAGYLDGFNIYGRPSDSGDQIPSDTDTPYNHMQAKDNEPARPLGEDQSQWSNSEFEMEEGSGNLSNKPSTSYEELRRQNREDYFNRQSQAHRKPQVTPVPPTILPRKDVLGGGNKNTYGDVWES